MALPLQHLGLIRRPSLLPLRRGSSRQLAGAAATVSVYLVRQGDAGRTELRLRLSSGEDLLIATD